MFQSHCGKRALLLHTPCKEPLSGVPSCPALSPSFADPEHTSSLAARHGSRDSSAGAEECPQTGNCDVLCLSTYTPSVAATHSVSLGKPLALSLYMFTHTHKYTWLCVPSSSPLCLIHSKNSHRHLTEEADWTAVAPPPLMTAWNAHPACSSFSLGVQLRACASRRNI